MINHTRNDPRARVAKSHIIVCCVFKMEGFTTEQLKAELERREQVRIDEANKCLRKLLNNKNASFVNLQKNSAVSCGGIVVEGKNCYGECSGFVKGIGTSMNFAWNPNDMHTAACQGNIVCQLVLHIANHWDAIESIRVAFYKK